MDEFNIFNLMNEIKTCSLIRRSDSEKSDVFYHCQHPPIYYYLYFVEYIAQIKFSFQCRFKFNQIAFIRPKKFNRQI